ncbi:MAG: OmpA family protein [Bacteroidales bacterium]|nr:OmpA family protein [Bacteroidales bacterium]
MKTEEFDKQFREKINSLQGPAPGANWNKEQTWEKLNQKANGKHSRTWLKYAAASITVFLVKSQNLFAGASMAAKATIIVSAVAAVTTTTVIISNSGKETPPQKNIEIQKTDKRVIANNETAVKPEISPDTIVVEKPQTTNEPQAISQPKGVNEQTTNNKPQTINEQPTDEQPSTEPQESYQPKGVNEQTTTDFTPPQPVKIDISDIIFKKNSTEILSQSYSELNYLLEIMRRNPEFKLLVLGYTDNKEKDSDKLSSDRGYIIYKYLTNQGIENGRITYKGYGAVSKYSNKTEEGRELNRRAEIIINK